LAPILEKGRRRTLMLQMDKPTDTPFSPMHPSNNSILVLMPYWFAGTWVFDDERTGLVREAFVAGVPEIINRLLRENRITKPEGGFRLTFSAKSFPTHQVILTLDGPDPGGGNWYCSDKGERGWLCPALFCYFREAPKSLFARVDSLHVER
jgi:hypothetical protein